MDIINMQVHKVLEDGKHCREKSVKVIWMDRGVRSLILNDVHVVGLPEKGIFEQSKEGSSKKPDGQVSMKTSWHKWWKNNKKDSVTQKGGVEKRNMR